jgi:hypothetical protein
MMSLIVPLIPLASKPRPACQPPRTNCPMGAAHKLPISNSSTTSAKFQLTLRMCVPFPTLLLRVQLSYGCVWVQGGCPSPACGRRRRRWRWAAGGGRACRPHHPTEAGVRRLQQAVGIGVTAAAAAAVRDRCACGRRVQPAAALRAWWGGGRAEASGGGASGGRGARRSRSAGAEVPPCAAAAAKVPAAMMWRELCAGGERGGCTSRLDQRDSASLTIATALA